jgi:hypothetical protein
LSVESLPYTLLLLLAQFTAGTAALVLYTQLRGTYEAAFIRVCSWMIVTGALCTTLVALVIDPSAKAEAYALDPDLLDPVRAASMALLLFSVVHWYYRRYDRRARRRDARLPCRPRAPADVERSRAAAHTVRRLAHPRGV